MIPKNYLLASRENSRKGFRKCRIFAQRVREGREAIKEFIFSFALRKQSCQVGQRFSFLVNDAAKSEWWYNFNLE